MVGAQEAQQFHCGGHLSRSAQKPSAVPGLPPYQRHLRPLSVPFRPLADGEEQAAEGNDTGERT